MTHGRRSTGFLGTLTMLVLACGLASCGPEERGSLRFDGLYHSEARTATNATYRRYLRFAEQGTVLSVSSTSPPAEVATLQDDAFESRGAWRIEDDVLRFSCTSPNGTVDYEGEVLPDSLLVTFHSHINDKRGETRYAFLGLAGDDAGP